MKIIDISGWPSGNQRYVPIGKRIKVVVHNPDTNQMFYFKEPKEKYPWEFWSEIIAYQVGKEFGFNVLEYYPASLNNSGGCLSPSMTNGKTEELIHGQQLLLRIYPEFELKKGLDHTFQLVKKLFKSLDEKFMPIIHDFIEMLVFDAIIGNRDRHQQNWALIRDVEIVRKSFFSKEKKTPSYNILARFSPLFDNGNCLAYNIIEENLDDYVDNDVTLEKYLFGRKAVSHVRWDGELVSHTDLLKLLYDEYGETINKAVERIKVKYNPGFIENLINDIDNDIIFARPEYNLSSKRKKLIIKLLQKRIQELLKDF